MDGFSTPQERQACIIPLFAGRSQISIPILRGNDPAGGGMYCAARFMMDGCRESGMRIHETIA